MAPKSNAQYMIKRQKKSIVTRPLPESKIIHFEKAIMSTNWEEIFKNRNINEQVEAFHQILRSNLDEIFPEKVTQMSNLDREWMTPELKQILRAKQREFFKHRKSEKYRRLRTKLKKLKRKTLKELYSKFVSDLKITDPGKWFKMAKRIGAVDRMSGGDIQVQALADLNNVQCVQKVAEHFAAVSQEYLPVNLSQLPCYLPALAPPNIEEYEVYERLIRLKKTKSTLPIDIPDKLRQVVALHLAAPLMKIYNQSLSLGQYPALWKHEWVTPAPKVSNPKTISDLRKIACTSDYSKMFEGFLKDWIIEDISHNLDTGQYGGQAGLGTEHMMVNFIDRIQYLLDRNPDKSAVIATSLDWAAAFDRQDPTLAIQKFIKIGVRASLIPLLISYLTDRKMQVKFNGEISDILSLIGGGPQGTLIGGLEYLVQSNDNAESVDPEDKYKYIDDLSLLQLVLLSGLLVDYNFHNHVASDIATDSKYLPPNTYSTQTHIDNIANWTDLNLMKLNETKCKYMIFSRSKEKCSTRLKVNGENLERI